MVRIAIAAAALTLSGCARLAALFESPPPTEVEVRADRAADAEANERELTVPIERALLQEKALASVSSRSDARGAELRVRFGPAIDRDSAAQTVRARLERIVSELPRDASPPMLSLREPEQPPLAYELRDPERSALWLRTFADDQVRLALLPKVGVLNVERCGGREPIVAVELDPARAAARGISASDVASALSTAIGLGGPAPSIEALQLVHLPHGAMLADVARISQLGRAIDCQAWLEGRPTIVDEVRLLPEAKPEQLRTDLTQLGAHVLPPPKLELVLDRAPAKPAALGSALIRDDAKSRTRVSLWSDALPSPLALAPAQVVDVRRDGHSLRVGADVCGPDLEQLQKLAHALANVLGAGQPSYEPFVDLALQPSQDVQLDRAAAARLGISQSEVNDALRFAGGGAEVALLPDPKAPIPVVLRTGEPRLEVKIRGVPVTSLATVTARSAPSSIRHLDGQRCIAVSAIAPDDPSAWRRERAKATAAALQLPAGYSVRWTE